MPKKILTVTFNPAIDRFLDVDAFQSGRDYRVSDLAVCAGGKGINVSRCLKIFGVDSVALSITAGGAGKAITNLLKKEGLEFHNIETSGESRVNFTIVDKRHNRVTRLLGNGLRADRHLEKRFLLKYSQLLKKSKLVVISGRGLEGFSKGFYQEILQMTHQKGVELWIDACPAMLQASLKYRFKPALIKFNEAEWEEFSGHKFNQKNSLLQLKKVYQGGVGIILITRAEKKAIGYNGTDYFEVSVPKISSLYDVGCGDIFLAGFLSMCIKTKDFSKQLHWAAACATASLKEIIPGNVRLSQIKKYYSSVVVKKIH